MVRKLPMEFTLFPTRLIQQLLAFVHPLLKFARCHDLDDVGYGQICVSSDPQRITRFPSGFANKK